MNGFGRNGVQTVTVKDGPRKPGPGPLLRGTNQSGMRDHNERLVLSLVRQHGSLAKSDIARMTGLSAQTVSVIMRKLEDDGLLLRLAPVRGRIGQPSVPMALNPEGAFFIGLKIGRRSIEMVLIDFLGNVQARKQQAYRYPTPKAALSFAATTLEEMRSGLKPSRDQRIAGLGIAMPYELWNWADTVGAPEAARDEWRRCDMRAEIQSLCPFPVFLQNDATAACGAELVFGQAGGLRNIVYFYIGAFAGGGIVLDGRLYGGPTGNAGALGSMPVPGPDGKPVQLIDIASIAMLEKAILARGGDASALWETPEDWGDLGAELPEWISRATDALAYAIAAAASVIDFEAAIIDGWMPRPVRHQLVAAVDRAIGKVDVEGLSLPAIREGTIGIHARAMGGASLPLSERFLVGSNSLAGSV